MIHLVRSVPRSYSGASSSTTLSIVEPIEKPIEKPILQPTVNAEVVIPIAASDDESMASRALIVLEHLGSMYPVEMSQAIAPVTMSSTMKDLYQNLTVQHVAFDHPNAVTVQPDRLILPANTPFVQDYPSQMLQAPVIPVRARKVLPPLPFLEVGSGLLAFTIVSGVVVVDGIKQAQNGPGKRVSPISSTVNDRTTRTMQAKAGMSDMEVLKSGRTLPVPGLAMGAPTGLSMGGMNLTPAQMSQLAMQQAIAASKVGTPVSPPTSVIPTLNTFALPQTGEALPAVPTVTPGSNSPALPQDAAPQPILLSPPAFRPRSPIESVPDRPPIVRQPTRQPDRPSARPSVATHPLPVPELPLSPTTEPSIAQPSSPIAPSPSPSPAMPIVRQSMAPEPSPIAPLVEERPRPAVPAQSSATTQAAATITPQVVISMRPKTSESIAPASLKPAPSPDFVPKDLVFKQETH